ncbi:MAG: hypothetical protein D6809_03540 [Gammaproteobacteria bacterium]|nr:MAG: hypothetical protein D6809_03540 [Gammaproteobacteria bacterium]
MSALPGGAPPVEAYTDLAGLQRLRRLAARGEEALPEVARQFEALFLQSLLRAMREAAPAPSWFGGERGRLYQDLFDKQLALELSRGRGVGLAEALVEGLRRSLPGAGRPAQGRAGAADEGSGGPAAAPGRR